MSSKWILIFSALWWLSCKGEKEPTPPNIIVFLVDDLGWQDTSVPFFDTITPNNLKFRTPHMEQLAGTGIKFTNAYAYHVCSPSRVSLMTGMNAARHKVTNWTLERDQLKSMEVNHDSLIFPQWNVNGINPDSIPYAVTADALPQLLSDHGYFTIHCGKAHFGAIATPGENPMFLGFDVNISGHAAGAPGSYYGVDSFKSTRTPSPWDVPGLDKYHGTEINLTEALTREAIEAVDSASILNKPFFLYMAHYTVHTPIQEDKRFFREYVTSGLDTIEARYASMVESMDKSLGDIIAYLDRRNISKNTLILFMSDNGGLSAVARGGEPHQHNAPLRSGKGSMHEGGIRVPMIAKWEGVIHENSISDHPVIIEDYYTTILDVAGINALPQQTIDGRSFLDILKGRNTSHNQRPLIFHYPNEWGPSGPGIGAASALIEDGWKLIYYHLSGRKELFHLKEDIDESDNLISSHPEKADALSSLLADQLRNMNAQMPSFKHSGEKVPFPDEVLNQSINN